MLWLIALTLLLQDGPKAGEQSTVTFESTMELDIVVRDGTGESTGLLNLVRKEKFAQTQVDPRSVKIKCLTSTLQKSGTNTLLEDKATGLQGNEYLATRGDNGWMVRDAEGNAAPIEGQTLGAWNDAGRLLGAGVELKEGAKWNVDAKDMAGLLSPSSLREATGSLECTCESVADGKANVTFAGKVSGKGKEDGAGAVVFTVKSGRLVYNVTKKQPVSLMLSGQLESTSDMLDVLRKPGTGGSVGNEEERRKIGEITVKSRKLETVVTFE